MYQELNEIKKLVGQEYLDKELQKSGSSTRLFSNTGMITLSPILKKQSNYIRIYEGYKRFFTAELARIKESLHDHMIEDSNEIFNKYIIYNYSDLLKLFDETIGSKPENVSKYNEVQLYELNFNNFYEEITKKQIQYDLQNELVKPLIEFMESEFKMHISKLTGTKNKVNKEPEKVKAFKWILKSEHTILQEEKKIRINNELEKLYNKMMSNSIIDCDLTSFQLAFSGNEITEPINIIWLNPSSRNKTTPDYSSIFNFLHALVINEKLIVDYNFQSRNTNKLSSKYYQLVRFVFSNKDGKQFDKDHLARFSYSSKRYPHKTEYFSVLLSEAL